MTTTDLSIDHAFRPFDLHVFVCTNTRTEKASCGPLGADTLRADLKAWMSDELKKRPALFGKVKIRVNGSGCLDFCKKGVVIAVYPQSEFIFFVKNTEASLESVKAKLRAQLDALEVQNEKNELV